MLLLKIAALMSLAYLTVSGVLSVANGDQVGSIAAIAFLGISAGALQISRIVEEAQRAR